MLEFPIVQTNIPVGTIDLGIGNPGSDLLPLELLHQAADTYFSSSDRRSLQYGREQGDGYFCSALADFLTAASGDRVDPDLLFVTTGASSALDLLCTLYTHPGDTIFVEEPTYFLALRIFEDHGLRVVSIPMDTDGLSLDSLDEQLSASLPKFIYTVPTFQNPSGLTLSPARREKLVERAQRYNFLVIADEVYQLLAYTQTPPPAFAAFTESVEQVISVNSFSKILAPGLRLGWVQAHATVIQRLAGCGLLDSGGGLNPFTSAIVRWLVESGGLEKNIAALRQEYTDRLVALDSALRQYLPAAKYTLPRGGFFFWVRLPGVNTVELRPLAQKLKVDFRPGTLFSSRVGLGDYLRLGFCFYAPATLEEGVRRLRACLEE